MKKVQVQVFGLMLAFSMLFAFSTAAIAAVPYFAEGSGTADDPFLISTAEELTMLSALLGRDLNYMSNE